MVEQVLNLWVSTLLPELTEEDFATGAMLAAEMRLIIGALEGQPKITARVDAKELHGHRRNLDQFCRSAYREVVSTHVIMALRELHPDQTADLAEIEAMARVARSLEETDRRVGPPQPYVACRKNSALQSKSFSRVILKRPSPSWRSHVLRKFSSARKRLSDP